MHYKLIHYLLSVDERLPSVTFYYTKQVLTTQVVFCGYLFRDVS